MTMHIIIIHYTLYERMCLTFDYLIKMINEQLYKENKLLLNWYNKEIVWYIVEMYIEYCANASFDFNKT